MMAKCAVEEEHRFRIARFRVKVIACALFLASALALFAMGHPTAGGWCIGLAIYVLV